MSSETANISSKGVNIGDWIDGRPVGRVQIMALILCALVVLFVGFNAQVMGYLAPAIFHDWKISPAAMAGVFTANTLGFFLGATFLGWIADKRGRKFVINISVALFGIFAFFSAFAQDIQQLSVLQFFVGLGIGGAFPNSITLTSEYFPHRNRGLATMTVLACFSIGSIMGGSTAAFITPLFGWHAVFLFSGLPPIVLTVWLLFSLPESIRFLITSRASPRRVEALLQLMHPDKSFTEETQFCLSEETRKGLTVSFLFKDQRAFPTILIWVSEFMILCDIVLIMFWLPTLLMSTGFTLSIAALMTTLVQIGGLIATVALGRLIDWWGFFVTTIPTFIIGVLACWLLGISGTSIMLTSIAAFVFGAAIVGGQNTVVVIASVFYPTFARATGVGWAYGVGQLGTIVASLLGGLMLSMHLDRSAFLIVSSLPMLCTALCLLLLRQTNSFRQNYDPSNR